MLSKCKAIISNAKIYKEIELPSDLKRLRVGTNTESDIRLHRGSFYESVNFEFLNNNGSWEMLCDDNLYISDGGDGKLLIKKLNHGDIFTIKYQKYGHEVFDVEFLIDFDNGTKKYERTIDISSCSEVKIGTAQENHIVLTSAFVKDDSIIVKNNKNKLTLNVARSAYGVYVNGKKATGTIVVNNGDFFSISDYSFYFKNQSLWTEIRNDLKINSLTYSDKPVLEGYPKFNRNSRVKTILSEETIEILDPPNKQQKPKNNLLTRLLPSMGMFVTAAIMAAMGGTMVIMSAISGVMAIITSVVSVINANKEYKKSIENRIEKYTKYIENKKADIEKIRLEEKENLEKIFISPEQEKKNYLMFSSELFDRTTDDEDFLNVYLGKGDIQAKREISYKKQERLEIEDDLQELPEKMASKYKCIENGPVVCDLKKYDAIGIVGKEEHRFALMKNIIFDICARQYHADVKMFFVATKEHSDKVEWLRLLPHVQNEYTGFRNIVCDDESKNIGFEYLYKELTRRQQLKKIEDESHIILFFYDDYGFKSHPISRFVNEAKKLRVTFVFFADRKGNIPLGCECLLNITDGQSAEIFETNNSEKVVRFTYKEIDNKLANKMTQLLAPVYTEEISLEGSLTKMLGSKEFVKTPRPAL